MRRVSMGALCAACFYRSVMCVVFLWERYLPWCASVGAISAACFSRSDICGVFQ